MAVCMLSYKKEVPTTATFFRKGPMSEKIGFERLKRGVQMMIHSVLHNLIEIEALEKWISRDRRF
jgi:hypothetical protein